AGVKKQSLVVAVNDHRTEVSGGSRADRYYGRCRLGLYGIPTPILDPKLTVSDRLSEQIKAGLEGQGAHVRISKTKRFENPTPLPLSMTDKSLTIRLNNVWMDFANPMTGNESILYFEATALVIQPGTRGTSGPKASVTRKYEKKFRYDSHDSLLNQGIKTLQPEFTQLLNDPAIRKALSSN
ncbi:MAG: hypothetical protein JWO82_178, partial [Akkermansiaceae bacterium]|nr:hypothetical protein [Akkermansiaceae bacterium]